MNKKLKWYEESGQEINVQITTPLSLTFAVAMSVGFALLCVLLGGYIYFSQDGLAPVILRGEGITSEPIQPARSGQVKLDYSDLPTPGSHPDRLQPAAIWRSEPYSLGAQAEQACQDAILLEYNYELECIHVNNHDPACQLRYSDLINAFRYCQMDASLIPMPLAD